MLAAKERAIQEMKRKIAEAEAKAKLRAKQASSGAQTPSPTFASPSDTNGSVPTNPRSSSVMEKDDAPSAQLLSEAVAAKAPKPAETPPTSTTDDRHLPDVPASKPAETDKERRKREKAERMRRLQEEMARLAAEDDDDEEEIQTQEVPPPAREAPVEEPVSVTQPMSNEPGDSLPTVSRDEHQDEVDVAKLTDPAADGPKSLDEPASDVGDKPEFDEANEEGEVDESEDVSMTDAPQAAEALEQPDVEMEGTADGIPAAAPLISTALDAGNSEQPSQGGDSTGPFLCPVEGCVKNTKGFTKHKFLKTHIRRLDRSHLAVWLDPRLTRILGSTKTSFLARKPQKTAKMNSTRLLLLLKQQANRSRRRLRMAPWSANHLLRLWMLIFHCRRRHSLRAEGDPRPMSHQKLVYRQLSRLRFLRLNLLLPLSTVRCLAIWVVRLASSRDSARSLTYLELVIRHRRSRRRR
jgi:hypothetical protein